MRCSLLLLTLGVYCLAGVAAATPGTSSWFDAGLQAYDAGDYRNAAEAFERAAVALPANDEYAYWLGKAYGRQAEHATWFDAIRLAQLTRAALERAVALNPENWPAVADLARYYAKAPGFLGGDASKAAALRERLRAASEATAGAP